MCGLAPILQTKTANRPIYIYGRGDTIVSRGQEAIRMGPLARDGLFDGIRGQKYVVARRRKDVQPYTPGATVCRQLIASVRNGYGEVARATGIYRGGRGTSYET